MIHQEVDQRLGRRRRTAGFVVGERAAHDRHEGVVAALGSGARERVFVGTVAVLGATCGDVGVEFELAEMTEDRFELDVDERVAAAAVEAQRSVQVDDVHATVLDRFGEVAVGAVEVGEHHEALHARAELTEAEALGLVEQHRGELAQSFPDPAVGVGDGELVGLWGADAALVECFGQAGDVGGDGGEATDSGRFGV